jgi:hypothetical protein
LILGGKRAVWVKYAGVMTREAGIFAARPGQKKPTLVDALGVGEYGGTHLTGLAADGEQTIVYGDARVTCNPRTDCSKWSLTEGGVHRIIGTKSAIAVVPAVLPDSRRRNLGAAPNGPVDVYNLSGSLLAQVVPQGTVREVALSWPFLAVIVVRADGTTVIERYNVSTTELLTATPMSGAANLAIGTGGIVFLVGKTIYTIHDGQPALLWHAATRPIGLSIEGRRVAWAAYGRIKALTLPR